MKYKDFEGTIQALVDRKLDEIEEMEGVKILHAVESGSRAWAVSYTHLPCSFRRI